MNLNKLRYLDRKIGVPLCSLFYLFKKMAFWRAPHKFSKENVKKILVIKIWGMGSIILASPLFKNLRENFPDSEIWFLTHESFQSIYPTKFFGAIETMKLKGVFSGITDFVRLIKKFRRQKFDLVIDLEIVSRYTALLAYFSGAKTKVGFEILGQNKDKLYDFTAGYHESKHITKTFLGTLESLGIDFVNHAPLAPEFSASDEQGLNFLLAQQKISRPYIVVNINASELSLERRLPLGLFKSIINKIIDDFPRHAIILIGSQRERAYVENFIKEYSLAGSKIFNAAGLFSLGEFFVLMKNAALVISNDSGPAQIAGVFDVPLVVFFGPESPTIYGSFSKKTKIFYSNLFCSPCISVYRDKKINCRFNQKCLTDIDLKKIYEAVKNFL